MKVTTLDNTCSMMYLSEILDIEKITQEEVKELIRTYFNNNRNDCLRIKCVTLVNNEDLDWFERRKLRIETGLKLIHTYAGHGDRAANIYIMPINW